MKIRFKVEDNQGYMVRMTTTGRSMKECTNKFRFRCLQRTPSFRPNMEDVKVKIIKK